MMVQKLSSQDRVGGSKNKTLYLALIIPRSDFRMNSRI
jgi:hypothetical protein